MSKMLNLCSIQLNLLDKYPAARQKRSPLIPIKPIRIERKRTKKPIFVQKSIKHKHNRLTSGELLSNEKNNQKFYLKTIANSNKVLL